MRLDHQFLKVWTAGSELLKALPPEADGPLFDRKVNKYQDSGIDSATSKGLDYLTCMTCSWHADWPQVFEYVVVRGRGTLWYGPKEESASTVRLDEPPKGARKITIQRGDIIQLWPMIPHRVTCVGCMAMISTPAESTDAKPGDRFKGFPSQKRSENVFLRMIREAAKRRY